MILRPPRSTLFPYRRSSDLFVLNRQNSHSCQRTVLQLDGKNNAIGPRYLRSDTPVLEKWSEWGGCCFPYNALVDRKSTRLNSSHVRISYAVFCLKKKK